MTVSVLIPACNAEATIAKTLKAIAAQSRAPDEILVCDDGSSDLTASLARSFPGVKVLSQPNGGTSVARNTLVENATGEVVAFCDADDRPHPEWLATLVALLERHDAEIALCGLFAGRDLSEKRYVYPAAGEGAAEGKIFYRQQLAHGEDCRSYLPCCAIRRELLLAHPEARGIRGLQIQEDEVLLLAAAKSCRRFAYTDQCLYDYLYREKSVCGIYFRDPKAAAKRYHQYFLRDRAKWRITHRPWYLAKALANFLRWRLKGGTV